MLLIKNLTVFDGSGSDGYKADILIDGDKIAEIRPGIKIAPYRLPSPPEPALSGAEGGGGGVPDARVIDGRGLAAAPGFIDIHAHSEFSLLAEPAAPSKIMQGVTTEVSGNCGLSAAPLLGEASKARVKDLGEFGLTQTWSDFDGFFALMESARPAVNFATYCGHGNLRASVMGYANREPAGTEFKEMEALLEAAMKAGALGLSTGLIYPPGVYSETEELIRLARVAARYGGVYTSHMRSEGARVVEAIEEAVRVGKEAGLPVQISHLKTAGPSNWRKLPDILDTIERARSEGVAVTADRYPYAASSTDLDAILPSWSYEGGASEEIKRLKDPKTRALLRKEVLGGHPVPEYWDRVMIASVSTARNKDLEGKTLAQAAEVRGQEPVEALLDILIEEEVRAQAIYFSMSEDNLKTLLKQDWMMVGSDSTARGTSGVTRQGKPHPRAFGSFPKVLGRLVREEGALTMPQAVRKLSAMAADKLGLAGRGYLRPGFFADIVVFDPKTVKDTATYEDPYRFPEGIKYVMVNGEVAVEDGAQTGARAGRVLRH